MSERDVYENFRKKKFIGLHRKAAVFFRLAENSAYWQVKIENEDREKTVLTSHDGFCRFKLMFFGLHDAFRTFQRTMDFALLPNKVWSVHVRLVDIVFPSLCATKPVNLGSPALKRLWDAEAISKLKQFKFSTSTFQKLGSATWSRHLETALYSRNAVERQQAPPNFTKLISISGLCIVFRRFLSNVRTANPSNDTLWKDQLFQFVLDGEKLHAMKILQQKLTSPPESAVA